MVPVEYINCPDDHIIVHLSLTELAQLPQKLLIELLTLHGICLSSYASQPEIAQEILSHTSQNLSCCQTSISLFQCTGTTRNTKQTNNKTHVSEVFPPKPVSNKLVQTIAQGYCRELDIDNILEAGCAVCGCLTSIQKMQDLS
ncbi:hypothetical protein DENSPDRAFT_789328, partial [Dentipellis sp. KUC8613]